MNRRVCFYQQKNNKIKVLLTLTIFLFSKMFTLGQSADEYFQLGNLEKNLGNYTNSISYYNKALLINPNGEGIYLNRGNAKRNLHDFRGAIKDFNRVIGISKNTIGMTDLAYNGRANCKRDLNDFKGAMLDYNKAILINPNKGEWYYNRGALKYKLKQKESACNDFSTAGELGYNQAYSIIQERCQ